MKKNLFSLEVLLSLYSSLHASTDKKYACLCDHHVVLSVLPSFTMCLLSKATILIISIKFLLVLLFSLAVTFSHQKMYKSYLRYWMRVSGSDYKFASISKVRNSYTLVLLVRLVCVCYLPLEL